MKTITNKSHLKQNKICFIPNTYHFKSKIRSPLLISFVKHLEIAKKLDISKGAVTQVLKKDKRYIEIKNERKIKNQKRHREETKDYIKTKRKIAQFKNNTDDLILKNMHNQASIEMSQPKRLNNMAYRNWNKSAYSYNEKKRRFEFKEELGRSYDVPKYIKVEVK